MKIKVAQSNTEFPIVPAQPINTNVAEQMSIVQNSLASLNNIIPIINEALSKSVINAVGKTVEDVLNNQLPSLTMEVSTYVVGTANLSVDPNELSRSMSSIIMNAIRAQSTTLTNEIINDIGEVVNRVLNLEDVIIQTQTLTQNSIQSSLLKPDAQGA